MKTIGSFGEWILDVFAALMRLLAPRYCVKKLTLRSRRNAYRFLVGSDKELRIIKKMGDKADKFFLQNRYWSLGTRVALLKEKNSALVNDARTSKEFMAVYALDDVELMAAVMRVYTPDHTQMLNMVNEKDATLVSLLASQVPTAFISLSAREILGVKNDEPLKMDSLRWSIAIALAKKDATWNVKFMEVLMQYGCKDDEAKNRFCYFFLNAVKAEVNVSSFMGFVYALLPNLAEEIRGLECAYKYFPECFNALFPSLAKSLKKEDEFRLGFQTSQFSDAAKWLFSGLRAGGECIVNTLISSLRVLKARLSEDNMAYLLSSLARNVQTAYGIRQLLPYLKEVSEKNELRKRLVSLSDGKNLDGYFPFNDWEIETAKMAVSTMVHAKMFPVERLNELSPELAQYAVEAMECCAQIAAIQIGKDRELLELGHLYPQAERMLFNLRDPESKRKYVQKFKMHASSFLYLLRQTRTLGNLSLLWEHAQKWGLTEEQYHAVMQSSYNDQAPFLVYHVCKEDK